MANVLYTRGLPLVMAASGVFRLLLVRSTSSYTPNKDHDYLSEFSSGGGVEITVASYARQTLSGVQLNLDDANDRQEFDFSDVAFGNLESGQTVNALLVYRQVGGDDTTPENDELIAYVDTATGLPAALTGGPFTVTIDTEGFIQFSQP